MRCGYPRWMGRSRTVTPPSAMAAAMSAGERNVSSSPSVMPSSLTEAVSWTRFHVAFHRGSSAISFTTSVPPGATSAAQDRSSDRWSSADSR